jgi:glycosyltransferase involved in cell wall biosynthesis
MSMPLISVILPTCGRLHYLRSAVASVFAQSRSDWELIIADDGSDHITRAYLHELAAHPAVRVIKLQHCGRPAAVRNAALQSATGRFAAFLDSDDIWLPTKLEAQIGELQARPGCRWSYTAFTRIDASDEVLQEESHRSWKPYDGEIFPYIVSGAASIRTPSVVAEVDLLASVGYFDETMHSAEDYDLWARLALRSQVALVNRVLVFTRCHSDSHSNDWSSAYVCRDYSLIKLRNDAGPQWTSLLARERSRNAITYAATYAAQGSYRDAARVLWSSARFSWKYSFWWLGIARLAIKCVVALFLVSRSRDLRQ